MKYFIYCRKSQEAEDRQVMSLESQQDEIDRILLQNPDIEIVDTYTEAFSAKQPGRPLFNRMMDRIERGEADGIIAWHPDRLARNSMDGGRIIFALDKGTLKDMRFCSYSFDNDPQGKFMLNICFGYSKYQVDTLSVNVKRGLQTKLKNGWKPNLAPIGYRNCKETKTILPDKKHFDAIKGMFELMLTGQHTPSTIHRIVCNDWGYTTPQRKRTGGKQPSLSTIYKLLSNPFYAGFIRWKGQLHIGSHEPLLTKSQFDRVQKLMGQKTPTVKTQKRSFPYTGLFKCGACGLSITAERKTKPSGKQYTYYHCTHRHSTPKCKQPAVNSTVMETQIIEFLDTIHLPDVFVDWIARILKNSSEDMNHVSQEIAAQTKKAAHNIQKQISNLTDLRTRDLVDDAEFMQKRQALDIELAAAHENIEKAQQEQKGLEPIQILAMFSNRAKDWHSQLDDTGKRRLLNLLGYNPRLIDKKAILEAKKPLFQIVEIAKFPRLCGSVQKVRTPDQTKINQKLKALASSTAVIALADEARHFIKEYDPQVLDQLQSLSSNHTTPKA